MSKSISNLSELPRYDKLKILGKIKRITYDCQAPQYLGCQKIHGEGITPWMQVKKRKYPVPTVVYSLLHDPIPEGWFVGHSCGHPWCVCASHLVLSSVDEHARNWQKQSRRVIAAVPVDMAEHLEAELYQQHLSGVRVRVLCERFSLKEWEVLHAIGRRAFKRG